MAAPALPGKNKQIQLGKGEAENALAAEAGGKPQATVHFMQSIPYAEVQTTFQTYKALLETDKEPDKAPPQLRVLVEASKIFLNPKYHAILMSGQTQQLSEPLTAETVDIDKLRAELKTLAEEYQNKGKRMHVQAVETILNSLDKGQLIAMARMQHIFDVLGAEISVPEGRMAALLEQMIKQGALARGDTMEIDRRFRKQNDAKASAVAKSALGYMVVTNDGKVVSKNKLTSGPMKDGRYRKDLPSPVRPHGSRFLQGQACGPARPVTHNFVVDTRECGLGVDIAENSPEFNESNKKSKKSVKKL